MKETELIEEVCSTLSTVRKACDAGGPRTDVMHFSVSLLPVPRQGLRQFLKTVKMNTSVCLICVP